MAITTTAYVSRNGQTAIFLEENAGVPVPVTAVGSNPTIKVNGTSVALVGPTWTPSTLDWPFVAYQMQCGGVQSILIQTQGSNYVAPVATLTGGGFSVAATLGTPVLVSGVIATVPITSAGTGAGQGQQITIIDSTASGSGFWGVASESGGGLSGVIIENGGKNYSGTPANLTVGPLPNYASFPSGCVFGHPTVANNCVWSIPVLTPGSGYTSAPTVIVTDGTGSGCVARAIMTGPLSTDTVTYSAAASWLTTSAGAAPVATNAAMTNSAGALEPGFTATPTMQLGIGIGAPNYNGVAYQKQQNWLKFAGPFTGALTQTADFHPLTINGTSYPDGSGSAGVPTTSITISNANYPVGIDSTNLPDQSGHWSFVADESSPGSPMVVSLYAQNGSGITVLVPLVAGYPMGGPTGKLWVWNVPRDGVQALDIKVCMAGPTTASSATYTLSNEIMAAPLRGSGAAQTINQALPYAPNPNITSMISGGAIFPQFIRCSPFGTLNNGFSNVVDVSDLTLATWFQWLGNNYPNANATAVRSYNVSPVGSPPWQSPYVWTAQQWPGTSAVGGGPAAFAWIPPNNGGGNNLDWMCNSPASSTTKNTYAFEVVCSSPHGFKTGQIITFNGGPVVTFTGSVNENLSGFIGPCFVTSATTFAMVGSDGALSNAHTLNAIGSTSSSFTVSLGVQGSYPPAGGDGLPYEALAQMVGACPNAGMWCFIPQMATDATIDSICTAIRDNLPVGRRVYLEYTDEHWNYGYFSTNTFNLLSNLANGVNGIAFPNRTQIFAFRQGQIHQRAVNIFNAADIHGNTGRGNCIWHGYGSFWVDAFGTTSDIVNFLNAYNTANPSAPFQADGITVAPYLDINNDAPVITAAAAAYSNCPGSSGYQTTTPWTLGAYLDLYRHASRYSTAQAVYGANQLAAIASYTLVAGQSTHPVLWGYEGSPGAIIPLGVSATDWIIRWALTYDGTYHPWYYDLLKGYMDGLSSFGLSGHQANELVSIFGNAGGNDSNQVNGQSDGYYAECYRYVSWEGQTWGHGDGSTDGNGNATVNLAYNGTGVNQELVNVSPKLQAWRDWALAANVAVFVTPSGGGGGGGGSANQANGSGGGANYAY